MLMPKPKIKLLNDTAIAPTKANADDAGFDIYAPERVDIPPSCSYLVGTGLAMAIPKGWYGQVNPRSSMAVKKIRIGARVIDTPYRGEVKINLHNDSNEVYEIQKGDRIAQIIFTQCLQEIEIVDELDETERGSGGFGSSGR